MHQLSVIAAVLPHVGLLSPATLRMRLDGLLKANALRKWLAQIQSGKTCERRPELVLKTIVSQRLNSQLPLEPWAMTVTLTPVCLATKCECRCDRNRPPMTLHRFVTPFYVS